MAWTTDLVLMTRILVNDNALPQTYTNEYIKRVLITAGIQVDAEFEFNYDYSYDIANITISPDPITSEDTAFTALVPLKAACILTQGAFQQALGQGIKVRDGDSAIDTSVGFRGYRDILQLGPCKAYEKLKWSLAASNSGANIGGAVLGPYKSPDGNGLSAISWYYDQFTTTGRRDRS